MNDMTMDGVAAASQSSDLIQRIEAEHAAVGQPLRSALAHAIAAGELLSVAKRQVRKDKGKWLAWLAANCTVPARTASHYMKLAEQRDELSYENGNVLPISVREAIDLIKHQQDRGGINGSDGSGGSYDGWGRLAWGAPFVSALQAVTRLTQCRPPKPRHVVKAAKAGKTPGLTAAGLREAIMFLTSIADALEDLDATDGPSRADAAGPAPDLLMVAPIAHQRRIREREAARDPRPQMDTLEGCTVAEVSFAEAKALVTRYEWLRTMPATPRACYGLKTHDGELVGVACFDRGPAPESGDICGRERRDLAVCLARGACVHWAHRHAASFLISRACKLAHRQFGWRVFYAYADPMAGEIGTVYQAANWFYLGAGTGRGRGKGRLRFFSRRDGKWRSARGLRKPKTALADLRTHPDWIAEWTPDKGRYVFFAGSHRERKAMRASLRYPVLPYPKRTAILNADSRVSAPAPAGFSISRANRSEGPSCAAP
jgi:hypothetical protein